jgi:mannitol/fructose-specific phosphotransferase system IIA component (Ntr-type)
MSGIMETIRKYLKKENIILPLEGETREDVFMELLNVLEKNKEIKKKNSIFESIIEWDKIVDSHRGKGVVLVRLPSETQKNISFALGIKKDGLDEEVFDRERSKIFAVIITPKTGNEEYVNLISEISSLLNQGSIREDILEARDQESIAKILLEQ